MIRTPSPPRSRSRFLPTAFPPNTRAYIQNPDGEVFSGWLRWNLGSPAWVNDANEGNDSIWHVYVKMDEDFGYWSTTKFRPHHIDINDRIPEKHRCLISYRDDILIAVLEPYIPHPEQIVRDRQVIVKTPNEGNTRYTGVLEHYFGRPPAWITTIPQQQ